MTPKFRVWHHELGRLMSVKCMFFQDSEIEEFELNDALMNDYITAYPDEIELMQSTGLKDKNGKEIFEGDVVKCNGLLGTIESFKAMWICSFMKYNNYQKVGFFAQEIEVVGNIYENPELLEDLK